MTKPIQARWWRLAATISLAGLVCGTQTTLAQVEGRADSRPEVLSSGPIHEAFLPVVSFSADAGTVVSQAPPEAIDELPPSQRPAGDHVAWIPGYWSWDDERDDFVWISGIWRTIPPGRQWVPGYWAQVDGGYHWVSGYWADAQASEVAYLPEPPDPIDEQPGDPASAEMVWVPGHWIWNDGQYAWQPGYWIKGNANWTWTPGYYAWAPSGYVYVGGYWDYAPMRRGLLFAPVYFTAGTIRPGSSFSPYAVVSLAVLGNSLFVNPAYRHYYYGNYYAASYATAGYYPWFSFNSSFGGGYDPVFALQRWQNREHRDWERTVQARFEQHRDAAGARRGGATSSRAGAAGQPGGQTIIPLSQLAQHKDATELKLQPVKKEEQQQITQESRKVRDFGHARQQAEGKSSAQSESREPATQKLPQSPIVGKSADSLGKDATPPAAPKTPEVDRNAKPKTSPDAGRRPGRKPGAKPEEQPDAKPAPRLHPKLEPKPDVKPEPKRTPKVEPKPGPKVEPKPEPRPAPKVEPKPEPKPAPKPEPKPEPKPAPKGESKPKPEPKPGPKA